ncbi:MAG: hypothetical protein ACRDNM_05470, partial [Gaiellaceae bacterium]
MTLQKSPGRQVEKTQLSRSTSRSIRGIIPLGRSTRSSGCMTLQIGWLHGGANWQSSASGFSRWKGLDLFCRPLLLPM